MRVLIFDSQADYYASRLQNQVPGPDYITATSIDDALEKAPGTEVIVALAPYVTPELIAAASDLRWIQALTTGVDNLMSLDGIAVTNCKGIHGPQMSEMAILLMMASARNFPAVQDNQKTKTWERWPQPLLAGKTACLVGVGAISEHLAGLLNAFGMTVTGVTGRASVPGFARTFPRDRLHDALAEADFVVLLTPYTPETHNLIDAEALKAMKPTAHLINLSRGGCLDENAVAAALANGTIAGAALDVFSQEPLPAESPLWSQEGLIITPHLGGFADVYHEQALPIVASNMAVYLEGGVDALKGRMDP
ncbi:D-2-hydroxyacid dehydrogenase [Pseudooceanicola sp. MF1-13]|uniref:D-2-hydroxyacid dehydrogenase n=1 Tax=Pseudooceanicola sp. MF1-13 TaxID=3379095 RepID=UPI003891D662